ncbi:hypothetical protein J437_LFUL002364 [Ladona fulva]|uniref:ADP-ribosylation factor-binding protein GGA1 n=1 Tax=Ladona fulva TaxID=123851 RepID=A0A8K0K561_LADFU|nr:hypothetical protein J437_LFUL002364 [Ladona fulva]
MEACMGGCGPIFRAEVGKFRFLNELIKLVSPKYLGNRTPPDVQARVLALLRHWASAEGQNPPLPKVREAYAMLRKQGVVKDPEPFPFSPVINTVGNPHMPIPASQAPLAAAMSCNSVPVPGPPQRPKTAAPFEDEHLSRLLQRLLQSKNPRDIQNANQLIKAMVRQEEMKAERRSKRATELESARTSARLLWEMLESWTRDGIAGANRSEDEKELMGELHASCTRISQILPRLASEAPDETTMAEVLQASDDLNKAMDRYTQVMVRGEYAARQQQLQQQQQQQQQLGTTSLLDLSTPSEEQLPQALLAKDLANLGIESGSVGSTGTVSGKELQSVLGDIFGAPPDPVTSPSSVKAPPILKPQSVLAEQPAKVSGLDAFDIANAVKRSGLNDLDALGESLLKLSLPPSVKPSGPLFHKAPEKIPMNRLASSSATDAISQHKQEGVLPLIGGSGMFPDVSSLSPSKESSKASDIELLSDLMAPIPASTVKSNSESNSLDYLIGLSLSGSSQTSGASASFSSHNDTPAPPLNPTTISSNIMINKSISSSISSTPSTVVANAPCPKNANSGVFSSSTSPIRGSSYPSGIQNTGFNSKMQDSSGLDSLEGLVESVLTGGGGGRQSGSEGVSFLENALKSLMHSKDGKDSQTSLPVEKSKKASMEEEGLNGSGDDAMVGLSDGEADGGEKKAVGGAIKAKAEESVKKPLAVKPIGDLNIPLQRIRPGKRPPIVALSGEEGSGMSVELRLGNVESGLVDRDDVSVLVVTITSRLEAPISNCLFQAVVPKGCRLRLLPASGTELPAHNPFLPPAAITQVMLIASPGKEAISLKWVLSYVTEDEETATEMGEVESLLLS